MVILKDLLSILHDITELQVLAYDNYQLQHEWIFGEKVCETTFRYYRRRAGRLSIIDRKINVHNDPKKNGTGEMGWDVKLDAIPKWILDAEVWHILLDGRVEDGRQLYCYVNMPAMDVEMARAELATAERPLEEET